MAETATRSPAAPADAAEETFELSPDDLKETPEGDDEVDLEDAEVAEVEAAAPNADDKKPEPKADVKPEPEPEVKPAPKVKVEEPEEPRERLHPAVREERNKRKEYAAKYAETLDKLDEAERTIKLLRAEADQADDPNLKKWNAELLERANNASDLAGLAKVLMEEMDRRDRARVRSLNPVIYTLQCDVSEAKARARHPDFEEVIAKAGLFEAIQTDAQGQWKDPRIAGRIYYNADKSLNADPAERMYRLALGKLEYEREQRGEPEPEEPKAMPTNGNGASPKSAPRAEELVEAKRQGAAEVVEAVSKTSARIKGLRHIPKAAAPAKITRKDLDVMLDREPQKYQRLISRQPELERWHLGG